MASAVNKFLRRSPSLFSRTLLSPIPASPSPFQSLLPPLLQVPAFVDVNPSFGSRPAEIPSKAAAIPVFTGFPYCLASNPVAASSFFTGCQEGLEESGEDRVVWADSVKKKRKKKMNKHKYRKLRKRLRRQT
ncbi:hypothetical protein MLD38_001084 [Melastoma candidum]|uniref:Uncharacterized protein n=1 Tax=Melastoma candidum TaxID=119954 RepID=A0ACB9SBJ6_9MYRT|nr:hypothetical protein MLD38_001084 [Melastoma candidum]